MMLTLPYIGSAMEVPCSDFEAARGECRTSGRVDGDHVDVSAGVTGEDRNPGPSTGAPSTGVRVGEVEFVYRDANDCAGNDPLAAEEVCRNDVSVTIDGTDIPWQPITMADIAAFRPAPPTVTGEPAGWAVVGLPANLLTAARQEVVPGVLLGEPAEVRFTPVSFAWNYGDGATRTLVTPGAPWDALGVRQFTPTPTSHVYADRGTVQVALTVTYLADYRFLGPDWSPVVGELDVSAPPASLRIVAAATMLVDGECGSGPGC
ncbi:MAG: hypothetical protein JWP66_1364 [Naasia sp.]|nr:hypothetical protein [Naasia sp.]